jgi:hypothetical protein
MPGRNATSPPWVRITSRTMARPNPLLVDAACL